MQDQSSTISTEPTPKRTPAKGFRALYLVITMVIACVIVTWMYTSRPSPMPAGSTAIIQGEMLDAVSQPAERTSASDPESSATNPAAANLDPNDPAYDWKSRKPGKAGNILVTLEELGRFDYVPPLSQAESTASEDAPTTPRIPAKFAALEGMKIATYGYMIPIDMEGNQIKSFILVSNILACCFGVMPSMNQWVHVTMAEGETDYLPNTPVLVTGRMEVSERWENDMVISIYRMTADSVRPLDGA